MTFSIAARDSRNGMLGVATASKALSVGGLVPYVRSGIGAIASQSFVNPYLGIDGLVLLGQGMPAERAIERLIEEDQGRDLRQLGIVDRDGRTAAYTGQRCIPWAGHVTGGGYVALGNLLANDRVVPAVARAFEESVDEELAERLMRAIEAGDEAGGDRRGRQGAGIYIMAGEEYPFCDLRVDDHHDPIAELRRILGVWQREEVPYLEIMPKRGDYIPQWGVVQSVRDQIERDLDEQTLETAKER